MLSLSAWYALLSLLASTLLFRSTTACDIQRLYMLPPARLAGFAECIVDGRLQENMSHVGADVAIKAQCWCQTEMWELIERWNCTEHEDFRHLYMVDCNATCNSSAANQCLQDCPALCLEEDYAPEGCNCGDCYPYMSCIAEHGKRRSETGDLDPICNDMMFQASRELNDYYQCRSKHPMRTTWQRYNSMHHCMCKASLRDAAQEHGCCGASWADGMCNDECLAEADCNSQEGLRCRQACRDTCQMIHPDNRTTLCTDMCFEDVSCAKYKTCEPLEPLEFEYVCDNGQPPDDHGCCRHERRNGAYITHYAGCPSACEQQRSYMMSHAIECQCLQCPTNVSSVDETGREEILQSFVHAGQQTLHDIAQQAGLKYGPTAEMQDLMRQRNEEIAHIVQTNVDSNDTELAQIIQYLVLKWNRVILAAAVRGKECQDAPQNEDCNYTHTSPTAVLPTPAPTPRPPVYQPSPGPDTVTAGADNSESADGADKADKRQHTLEIMLIVLVVLVVICGGLAGLAICAIAKKRLQHVDASPVGSAATVVVAGAGSVGPQGNSPQIVVGRPCADVVEENVQTVRGAPAGNAV